MGDSLDTRSNAISEAAQLKFQLRTGRLYDNVTRSTPDRVHEYSKEGIASLGEFLRRTADAVAEQFESVEEIFVDVYITSHRGKWVSKATEVMLRSEAREVLKHQASIAQEVTRKLCASFDGPSSKGIGVYLEHISNISQMMQQRLEDAVTVLVLESDIISPTKDVDAPIKKKKSIAPIGWEIVRSLGEGGQGWTYLVRRSGDATKQSYVFKRLKNADRARRLEGEITALEILNHPGILKIIESGQIDELPFYISEYCENGDLSKWSLAGDDLLEKLALYRQVCNAIAAAHRANIIHRDIKPSNILIREDRSVAVGDFGLCLHLSDIDDRLTAASEAIGARNYIAPELEDGRLENPEMSADVYSLGKLLYFLLSGRSLAREKHRSPTYDLRLGPEADPSLYFIYDLLDKTITASPQDRFQNASELCDALDGVIMKIEMNANVLDMKVRQHCVYCIVGEYRRMQGPDGRFGLKLICWNCGNIQEFAAQNRPEPWWLKT